MRKLPLAVLVLTALLFANQAAHAQMGTDNNPMRINGWDSVAGLPCTLGGVPFNTNCKLPDGGSSFGGSVTAASGAFAVGWSSEITALLAASTTSAIPVTTAAMTGTTSTQLIPAPSGSLHNYVSELHCVNSSATVGTFVSVLDGVTNIDTLGAAISFGGHEMSLGGVPFRQPTAATALNVQDVTTGANVICSAKYFTGP